jgi:hypothetical protein
LPNGAFGAALALAVAFGVAVLARADCCDRVRVRRLIERCGSRDRKSGLPRRARRRNVMTR